MSELSLSERIKKDFDEFCDSQDDFCNGCPYISHGMCEIDYTVDYVRTKVRADTIDSCKTVVMETIDNELLVDTLLMRMDKLNESMTVEEINTKKYIVCCPMCDNETCAKGTTECEAEKWKAAQLNEQSNTYTAIVDGVKREFM